MTRLRQTLKSADALVEAGLVESSQAEALARVGERYAIAVTPAIAALIPPHDAADPIARQFLPDVRELTQHPAEIADPIGDLPHTPVKGLVHRYRDRVLLKIVGVCPVYCRFCFRREMVGPDAGASLTGAEIDAALAYVRAHPEIFEVILTGGDPLVLSPRRIAEVSAQIASIPHVRSIRWHTRVPAVSPERVTDQLVDALGGPSRTVFLALHVNHPRELTDAAVAACRRLARGGVHLLSQSVLLKSVNDDAGTLEALMRALIAAGVKPYYLHHPDLAPGTAHFRLPIARGQALVEDLRRRVTGIAMPTYVLDIPGGFGKVPLAPPHVVREGDGYVATDAEGRRHVYRDAL